MRPLICFCAGGFIGFWCGLLLAVLLAGAPDLDDQIAEACWGIDPPEPDQAFAEHLEAHIYDLATARKQAGNK